MAYECIKVEERNDGTISELTLCPAPANILSEKMMQEITEQLSIERKNRRKKLIVFSGEGKHFSFGASVEEHKPEKVGDMLPNFHKFIGKLLDCEIPTLAKVSGLCLGGSFELVLGCTFVFANESAKFGVPEIQLAVFPPVASVLLPLKCSEVLSSQIILTGGQFTAEELSKHGLVNKVTEKEKLDEAVDEFFEKEFLPKSASSIRMAHRACRMVIKEQYENFIGPLEKLYLDELMATKDAVEGINSFLEKRPPAWQDE